MGLLRQINPTGKIPLPSSGKSTVSIVASRPTRGACARHERAAGCDGRLLRLTTAWMNVRQNRVVLAPVAGVKLQVRRKLRSGSRTGSDGVNPELVSGESAA